MEDGETIKNKKIQLKKPQEIILKRWFIDELGFSNLKGNGFEPNYNYYNKNNKILTLGNSTINSSIDYMGEYTVIYLREIKNWIKNQKITVIIFILLKNLENLYLIFLWKPRIIIY